MNPIHEYQDQVRRNIQKAFGIYDDPIEKGRKADPVGTVRNGRKKTADGKWVPVKSEGGDKKHKVGDKVIDSHGNKGTVVNADDKEVAVEHENGDVSGYTHDQVKRNGGGDSGKKTSSGNSKFEKLMSEGSVKFDSGNKNTRGDTIYNILVKKKNGKYQLQNFVIGSDKQVISDNISKEDAKGYLEKHYPNKK